MIDELAKSNYTDIDNSVTSDSLINNQDKNMKIF